jgi:hypothetical protein
VGKAAPKGYLQTVYLALVTRKRLWFRYKRLLAAGVLGLCRLRATERRGTWVMDYHLAWEFSAYEKTRAEFWIGIGIALVATILSARLGMRGRCRQKSRFRTGFRSLATTACLCR